MKKVFIDSDIILDYLLKRPEFHLPAVNIMTLAFNRKIDCHTSSVIIVNVHYLLGKIDKTEKIRLLSRLRAIVSVVAVNDSIIDSALSSTFSDFEDAVQYFSAKSVNADVIITRNIKDYKQSTIPVLTAEQFLRTL